MGIEAREEARRDLPTWVAKCRRFHPLRFVLVIEEHTVSDEPSEALERIRRVARSVSTLRVPMDEPSIPVYDLPRAQVPHWSEVEFFAHRRGASEAQIAALRPLHAEVEAGRQPFGVLLERVDGLLRELRAASEVSRLGPGEARP